MGTRRILVLDEIRAVLFALVCMVLGVQTVLSVFLLSMFITPRSEHRLDKLT